MTSGKPLWNAQGLQIVFNIQVFIHSFVGSAELAILLRNPKLYHLDTVFFFLIPKIDPEIFNACFFLYFSF